MDNSPENPVPGERPVRLDEWDAVDEYCYGRQAGNDLSVDPFAISVRAGLASAVQVDAVQASNGDCEDELEESKNKSDDRTQHAAAAGAVAYEVESAHVVDLVCWLGSSAKGEGAKIDYIVFV